MTDQNYLHGKLLELKSTADIAYYRWLVLYRDKDCLIDQEKRTAMLQARQDYQDAVSEYVFLFRTKKPPKRP